MKQHSAILVNQSRFEISDRSKEKCPKTRGKGISCKECHINVHTEGVVGNKETIQSYKSGRLDFECEECY